MPSLHLHQLQSCLNHLGNPQYHLYHLLWYRLLAHNTHIPLLRVFPLVLHLCHLSNLLVVTLQMVEYGYILTNILVYDILPVIQAKFEYPCHSWKVTPLEKKYKWLPQYEQAIRCNWNKKCGNILQNAMHRVRLDLEKGITPNWIPDDVMVQLKHYWESDDYKVVCQTAKNNRASTTGDMQHKRGSIPSTEHKKRLISQLGRPPTMFELFKHMHYDETTGQFVDYREAEVYICICFSFSFLLGLC